ncbi:hypothetical protein H9Q71_003714 [Fusarium xylarioides]|nr:hypothetical protein H9Q71_003714 [Fusarium xylarioides]
MSSSPRISPFITVSYVLLTCSLIFIYTIDPFYFHILTFSFTLTVFFRQVLAIIFAVRNGRAYGTAHRPPPPPEARLRKVGYPTEADLTDASAYPSCLVPEAITYEFGTAAHFAFLFKICKRKCDENPICVFSPVRGLRAQTHEQIWGHTFCIELCRLMTHPVFEMEGTNNLTLILQYAVICRTDDRRPWKMPPIPDGVEPLKQLRGVMQSCTGPLSTPISDIFASHCTNEAPPRCIKTRELSPDDPLLQEQQAAIKTYLTDPRHLIFVMLQLAKVVQDSPTEGPYTTKERGFDVYSVTTLDLQNIRKAIDAMELHYGEGSEASLFKFPLDLIFSRYVAQTQRENVGPQDSDELSDLIVAGSMKREREIFDTTLCRHRQ